MTLVERDRPGRQASWASAGIISQTVKTAEDPFLALRARSAAGYAGFARTLRDETPLRYRDWVERNRAKVHAASGGKLGYVHIPNMGPVGYAEFHRSYLAEVVYDAMVVDEKAHQFSDGD